MQKLPTLIFGLLVSSTFAIQAQQRGDLIDYGLLHKLTVGEIKELLSEFPPSLVNLALLNDNDTDEVEAYRLLYYTVDAHDNLTIASGAVFLSTEPLAEAPLAAYMHGTITSDEEAPSRLGGDESLIGWILAADGYVAILPDYLGLGDNELIHPYSHADTEASASIDMIIASRKFLEEEYGMEDKKDLFLTGYSQGGHATVAVQREIERNYSSEFNIIMNVAGSGAYCMSTVQRYHLLSHPKYKRPAHIPYLILGYRDVYSYMNTDLDDIFRDPYDDMMPDLFDGTHTIGEIEDELDITYWPEILTGRYYLGMKYNYFHPMNRALRDNDLIDWKPENRLMLLYCGGDEIVNPHNSAVALLVFHLKGAYKVSAMNLGPFSHLDCVAPVLTITKIMFDCNSGINPCIFDRTKASSDLDPYMNELDIEEASMIAANYEIEELNELYNPDLSLGVTPESKTLPELEIYPNPASDHFTITFDREIGVQQISLVNILGQEVRNYSNPGKIMTYEIHCNGLPSGIYNIIIKAEKNYMKRVVIE